MQLNYEPCLRQEWSNLPAALTVLTHLDPLSYGVDGLRGAFIGQTHFGVAIDLAVLGTLATLFLSLRARVFSRIQVSAEVHPLADDPDKGQGVLVLRRAG